MSDITRKEAIKQLHRLKADIINGLSFISKTQDKHKALDSLDMAIASMETDEEYGLEYEQPEFCKDCISREAVYYYISSHINEIITESGTDKNAHTNAILRSLANGIKTMPSVYPENTVSLSAYKQVAWERDIAIEQLKELGYEFGEKIEASVLPNVHDINVGKIESTTKNDLAVDCNNCKNNLHRGDGSTYCATCDGMCHYECEEPTTKNDLGVDKTFYEQIVEYCNEHFLVLVEKDVWEDAKKALTTKNDLGVDAISRVKAIEEADKLTLETGYDNEKVIEMLNELPSVTPQEPKIGHWEYGYVFADGNYCKCSECKEIIKCTYPMHYCPNCGVKMESRKENTNES